MQRHPSTSTTGISDRFAFRFAVQCFAFAFQVLGHAGVVADQAFQTQSWHTLQGDLIWHDLSDTGRVGRSHLLRDDQGDVSLLQAQGGGQVVYRGQLTHRVEPAARSVSKTVGSAAGPGARQALLRLLAAGGAERPRAKVVAELGDRFEMLWADWPRCPTITAKVDSKGRLASAHVGWVSAGYSLDASDIHYEVKDGHAFAQAWTLTEARRLPGGLTFTSATRYKIEDAVLDQPLAPGAFGTGVP